MRDSERELEVFRKKQDREKAARIREIEEAKDTKLRELEERQQRLFSWEEQEKRDQD